MKDIIIIGGGPAGFTAAIYASRAGLSVQLFEKMMWGGQAALTPEIENFPGIEKISGFEFAMKLHDQVEKLGVQVDNIEVTRVELEGSIKRVYSGKQCFEAKAVIVASGVSRRLLGCTGEERLKGKGVSYCATCDGAFFRDANVALVGGGNTAIEDALFLANHCKHVYVIHRRDEFRADFRLIEKIKERENVTFVLNSEIVEIKGADQVEGIEVKSKLDGECQTIPVQGVFVAIGYEPDLELFEGQLILTTNGYIKSDQDCHTNINGVFVAGDCREKKLRQIVTAAADGAIAGFEAANYCNVK